jgi:DNA replication and repair protein RecF
VADPAMATIPSTLDRATLQLIVLRDYRNLARLELAPPADGFALVGENGQGKTNLLESIYYLQLQRSFRGARDVDLVAFGAEGFHIGAEVCGGNAHQVSIGFERAGRRKRVTLDGKEMSRLSDAIGALPSVIFSPADVALVAGSPSERRRYLDVVLALTSRSYLRALQRYRTALANRNAALRQQGGDVESGVAVWEPALAEHGAALWRARAEWTESQSSRFTELCAAIGESGRAELRLSSTLEGTTDPASGLLAMLAQRRQGDLSRGITQCGPHRDDLLLTLNGRDLRSFGSAGQQRTAAIVLRLLEAATLRVEGGSEPVILLDDPFAELDARRSARMLALLLAEGGMGQIILAVPREVDIPGELTRLDRWTMRGGALLR